jgi:hypothetical protein
MRKSKPPRRKPAAERGPSARPQTAGGRVEELLARLEGGGPNPLQAAEELDRLQASAERAGTHTALRERVAALCDRWAAEPGSLRGDRARAWLTLAGAFDLKAHAEAAAELAAQTGLPAPVRAHACRVLPRLGGGVAAAALQSVLLSNTDAAVRGAAAEALGELGAPGTRPVLEALLEEDLPRPLWNAVSAALDRVPRTGA